MRYEKNIDASCNCIAVIFEDYENMKTTFRS